MYEKAYFQSNPLQINAITIREIVTIETIWEDPVHPLEASFPIGLEAWGLMFGMALQTHLPYITRGPS